MKQSVQVSDGIMTPSFLPKFKQIPPVLDRKNPLNIESVKDGGLAVREARVSTLLDFMRAPSPARAKPATAMTRAASLGDEKKSWILRHPSALSKFEKITIASRGKKIVMLLDYDGMVTYLLKFKQIAPVLDRKNLLNIESVKDGGHAVTEARVSTLLDSMRASSPARAKPATAMTRAASLDEEKKSWILSHPSALSKFEKITTASRGKKIVMFLDYDGTLSPIVEDPDRAFMTPEMRKAVEETAKSFPTAIVSGRCRDKVYSFVKLTELYYAGSHGMDIRGPPGSCSNGNKNGESVLCQPASEFLPMIDEVYEALLEKTKSIPGARVENNKFCLSVHFRCVDEKSWDALAKKVKLVLSGYPKLKLTPGRKVLEIRPIIEWNKGNALEFLLKVLGFANPDDDVFPIYIGDDQTDEDAFKVLKGRGQGIGILVSKVPKETNATYSLQEPSEVMSFLHCLANWNGGCLERLDRV